MNCSNILSIIKIINNYDNGELLSDIKNNLFKSIISDYRAQIIPGEFIIGIIEQITNEESTENKGNFAKFNKKVLQEILRGNNSDDCDLLFWLIKLITSEESTENKGNFAKIFESEILNCYFGGLLIDGSPYINIYNGDILQLINDVENYIKAQKNVTEEIMVDEYEEKSSEKNLPDFINKLKKDYPNETIENKLSISKNIENEIRMYISTNISNELGVYEGELIEIRENIIIILNYLILELFQNRINYVLSFESEIKKLISEGDGEIIEAILRLFSAISVFDKGLFIKKFDSEIRSFFKSDMSFFSESLGEFSLLSRV